MPAYLTANLWAVWRGRNFYFDNRFEVEAFQTSPSRHGAQSAVASEVTPGGGHESAEGPSEVKHFAVYADLPFGVSARPVIARGDRWNLMLGW